MNLNSSFNIFISAMESKIEKIKGFRLFLLKQIENLSIDQLNEIPIGFGNNIIWNLGHLISVQQNMCYVKAGLPVCVHDAFVSPFLPGTKPKSFIQEAEIHQIKETLITSADQLQSDYEKGIFGNYSPAAMITKTYGFEVNAIDSALEYVLHHDGLHAGYLLAQKKLLTDF